MINQRGIATALLAVGGFVAFMFATILILGGMYFKYSNTEIRLRNQCEAQENNAKVVFDNTWKIIQQQAGIADEYKTSFAEIYPKLMDARYGGDKNLLVKFVTEHNPNFDTSLYKTLMSSIETQRNIFTAEQKKLIDLCREHKNLIQQFPGSIFLSGRPIIDPKIVTSTKTEKVYESGKDDDVNLFHKPSPAVK